MDKQLKLEIITLKKIGESLKDNNIKIPESTSKIIVDRLDVISNAFEKINQEKDIDIIIYDKIIQQQKLFIEELQKELENKTNKLNQIKTIV